MAKKRDEPDIGKAIMLLQTAQEVIGAAHTLGELGHEITEQEFHGLSMLVEGVIERAKAALRPKESH